ncbi:hypothetical protein, conserved [Eimeria necatrix]|uniref:B9 domain-containing protein 1 n=1 Tax=Eimeria necatrix TaxID=51315 RepID=U6MG96_9EIME|nr:hypothetical protein, conserved [Eimeria necatrix]CDJ62073.1 hypothetical protein, conserved [Eimeria necatrix]
MLQQQDQRDQQQQQQQLLPQQQQQQQEDELQALLEPCALIPDSHLLLVASGCVEAVELWGNRGGVVCRYAMVAGSDWQQTWGLGSGLSQESRSSYSSSKVVLNFPFHAAFKGTSPYGWPRMAFCFYGRDWLGRQVVAGYAQATIPLQPGRWVETGV